MIKKYVREPFRNFIQMESSGAIILFGATILALILANSPWGEQYFRFLEEKLTIGYGGFELSKPLLLWINDGLMALFFFMIGLEIKREVLVGELSNFRKAVLPIFAAVGGIVIPVSLFFLLNQGAEGASGWGIPMATDIAFTLGILKILGDRVPIGLKVFLTAYAIIDDLGAVLIIAIFYSGTIYWNLILIALGLLLGLGVLNRYSYSRYLTLIIGILVWYLFLKAGIHPTIAGVLMALVVPIQRRGSIRKTYESIQEANAALIEDYQKDQVLLSKQQMGAIESLQKDLLHLQPPLQRLEDNLHGWSAYVIIPIFALANAGVSLGGETSGFNPLAIKIAISMLFGKAIGIALFSYLSLQLGLADLPKRVTFTHIIGLAFLGGLGFTMALFIGGLAYAGDAQLINYAKIGILIGSVFAGLIGYLILRSSLKPISAEEAAQEE